MNSVIGFIVVNGIWILIAFGTCCISVIFAEKIKKIPWLGELLAMFQRAVG